jgi:zinc protease
LNVALPHLLKRLTLCLLIPAVTSCVKTEPLPVDPNVEIGKLDNGLTYYIRVNHKPENRAELRLVVRAGSVLEDDDQLGLAHFIEHMAFNGTRHFEKQELIEFIESIGMQFGAHLNAYTGFDETVYMLRVPLDDPAVVEKAFLVLEDWAANLTLDPDEIELERGVVIEEWRSRRGAGARMLDKQIPIMFQGSKYAARLPIGEKEILETFEHDTLERFYRDWYRPDLTAVIAVGDFDPERIRTLIHTHFGGLSNPDSPRFRDSFPVPDHEETLFAPATDPEATRSTLQIVYKHPVTSTETIADYRKDLVEAFYNMMLNQRLSELTQEASPPFLSAYSAKGRYVATKDAYAQHARVQEGQYEEGLDALLTESERVQRHGFTQSELDRSRTELGRQIEASYKEREKTQSGAYASEYVGHFLRGEPIPGIENELAYYNRIAPGITAEEVSHAARTWITSSNRVVLINGPDKKESPPPGLERVLGMIGEMSSRDVEPYDDKVLDSPLLPQPPVAGKIVASNSFPEIEVEAWTLSNGLRVYLKSTDFKNDQVLLTAFSPGGHSLADDTIYTAATTADGVILQSGIGAFGPIELQKKLSGKVVSVSPSISELWERMDGNASPEDLETMFQLIYLYFTSPRKDEKAFQSLQTRMTGYVENRLARPGAVFNDEVKVALSQGHFRRRPMSLEIIGEMNLDSSIDFYTGRFADAGDFTFVLVGNFTLESVRPFVETYLGGLPAAGRVETWKDVGVRRPAGSVDVRVDKGKEPKSQVVLILTGEAEWSVLNNYELSSAVSVLNIKLREKLREELGGVYSVNASGDIRRYPYEYASVAVNFSCAPENVDELIEAVFEEMDRLKEEGPQPEDLQKVKETQLRNRETQLKRNNFWRDVLAYIFKNELDPNIILTYEDRVKNLTAESVQESARKHFDRKNYLRGVLYPEEEVAAE